MKATLYSRAGVEIQEVNCIRMLAIEGGFQQVVRSERDAMAKALGTETGLDPHFITNTVIHGDGVETGWREPDADGAKYNISLHDSDGAPIKTWDGCLGWNVVKGSSYFWNEGRWHVVTGDVIAELVEKKNNG